MRTLTKRCLSPRPKLLLAVAALLAACNGVEVHNVNIQTAATGTEIEARQVVALVYAQKPDVDIERLLYSGGDLSQAVKGLRDRYPRLRALLDQGVIGNTASGFVALRDPARATELRGLLWDENRDRAFLYNRASAAVGHGGDSLSTWLPYASFTFGREWIAQGQPGWWALDEERAWSRQVSDGGVGTIRQTQQDPGGPVSSGVGCHPADCGLRPDSLPASVDGVLQRQR